MKVDGVLLLEIIDSRIAKALEPRRMRELLGLVPPGDLKRVLRGMDGEIRRTAVRLLAIEDELEIPGEPRTRALEEPSFVELDDDDDDGSGDDEPARVLPMPPRSDRPDAARRKRPRAPGEGAPAPAGTEEGEAYLRALREAKEILGPGAIAVTSGKGLGRRFCVADREGDTPHCYVGASWEKAIAAARDGILTLPPVVPLPMEKDIAFDVARAFSDELWGKDVGAVQYSPGDTSRGRCCLTNGPQGTEGRRMVIEGSFLECFVKYPELGGATLDEARERALAAARKAGVPLPAERPKPAAVPTPAPTPAAEPMPSPEPSALPAG